MNSKLFSNKAVAVLLAMVVSVLWGTLFPTIKIGYQVFGIDTTQVSSILLFAGLRFSLSGLILVGADITKTKALRLPGKAQLGSIFLISMLTVIVHYALTYTGLAMAESSKSSVLKQIAFLVVPAVVFLFRKEDAFSAKKIFAAMLGFGAVICVNMDGSKIVIGIGEILIILASFSSMFGQLVSKNAYDKYEPSYMVAYSQLLGGLILLVAGFLFGGRVSTVDGKSIAVLAYICFASISANLLWNALIKYNDISRLAVLKSMDPLFASVFSAILLGEKIWKPNYLIAVALIVAAVSVSNFGGKRHESKHI